MKTLMYIILLCPCMAFAQVEKLGSISNLTSAKDFKYLFTDLGSIPANKLAYMDGNSQLDADSCLNYQCTDDSLLKVHENLILDMVGFKAYDHKIVNVYLFFKKADGYKVLSYFLNQFGLFTSKPSAYQDIYYWDTKEFSLALKYDLNTDLGVAILTNNKLNQALALKAPPTTTYSTEVLYSSY